MSMLRVRFFKVRAGKVERLRTWMKELSGRRDEVVETFENETVRRESVYLLDTMDGPVLIHVMEADDMERASRAVEEHPLPIDVEHRAVMREVLAEELHLPPLFDESV